MRIDVQIDTRQLDLRMRQAQRNLVYSTVQALNDTAKEIQRKQRAALATEITVRKKQFMANTIKIFEFANVRQSRLYAVVGLDSRGGKLILPMLETSGRKQPMVGKNVAIPLTGTKVRRSFKNPVASKLAFDKLDFQQHTTAGGHTQWKGKEKTFLIPGVGVFQRVKKKGRKTRKASPFTGRAGHQLHYDRTTTILLYRFQPTTPIKKRLDFRALARGMARTYFRTALTNRSRGML